MGMTVSPCKGCERRYVGCHAECEDYNTWALLHLSEERAAKEARSKERVIYNSDFVGTSPRPGHHRKTKHTKR